MKKMSQRKRLNRTLKIADIDDDMTNFRALPEPAQGILKNPLRTQNFSANAVAFA